MAEPRYTVVVKLEIGEYRGEWTGKEIRMEPEYTIVCNSPSREFAELVYKRLTASGHTGFCTLPDDHQGQCAARPTKGE